MRKLGLTILIFIFSMLFPISAELQELDRSLFKASNMVSFETAKKEMKQVYLESGQTKTLHCGCFFDKQKQVYPNICDLAPKRRGTKDEKKSQMGSCHASFSFRRFYELLEKINLCSVRRVQV